MNNAQDLADRLSHAGYRAISNRHRIVARIDREDWVEWLSRRLRQPAANFYTPGDPEPDGQWCDYYRRTESRDRIVDLPASIFELIPNSSHDPCGFRALYRGLKQEVRNFKEPKAMPINNRNDLIIQIAQAKYAHVPQVQIDREQAVIETGIGNTAWVGARIQIDLAGTPADQNAKVDYLKDWGTFHNRYARHYGWCLTVVSGSRWFPEDRLRIECDDEAGYFVDDDAALHYVKAQATKFGRGHVASRALRLIDEQEEAETKKNPLYLWTPAYQEAAAKKGWTLFHEPVTGVVAFGRTPTSPLGPRIEQGVRVWTAAGDEVAAHALKIFDKANNRK
jgi:hypothetical protein